MIEIICVDEPALAHLILGFLETHGIPGEVLGDQAFWSDGSMVPRDMRPTVCVPADQADEARTLLQEFEENRVRGDAWTCAKCDDLIPPAFAECPVCRVVRPPRRG